MVSSSPLPPTFCLLNSAPQWSLCFSDSSHCNFLCSPASPSRVCLWASLCLLSPLSPSPNFTFHSQDGGSLQRKAPNVLVSAWALPSPLHVEHRESPTGTLHRGHTLIMSLRGTLRQMKWVKIVHIVRHTVMCISNPGSRAMGETYNLSPIFCFLNLLVQP